HIFCGGIIVLRVFGAPPAAVAIRPFEEGDCTGLNGIYGVKIRKIASKALRIWWCPLAIFLQRAQIIIIIVIFN
ncbi:MAG: hypothetical protein NWP79_08615, partial [Paracoccaceae bacterium]|nr:hypothetical protein [Paracoccaceae bacterium]